MGVWEAYFRCQYEYPLVEISAELPSTPLYSGCLGNRLWVQVPALDPDAVEVVSGRISRAGGHIVGSSRAGDAHLLLIAEPWSREQGLHPSFESSQCRLSIPWMYRDGWGFFRVLSLDEGHLRSLFDRLELFGSVRLLRKSERPLDVLSTAARWQTVFSDLTPKQAEAILQAHSAGYYSSPRAVTRADIARKLGVGRTTYEEHLRKAERKVMLALVPALSDLAVSRPELGPSLPTRRSRSPVPSEWRAG